MDKTADYGGHEMTEFDDLTEYTVEITISKMEHKHQAIERCKNVVLTFLKKHTRKDELTKWDIAKGTGISASRVSYVLQKLKDEGRVYYWHDRYQGGYWFVLKKEMKQEKVC
jgi:DNA-binding transcriptional regulator LsrR (DeoR family)